MKLPKTNYAMHNMLNELAILFDDLNTYGEDWDIEPENIKIYIEAVKIFNQDWSRYEKEEVPEDYQSINLGVEL